MQSFAPPLSFGHFPRERRETRIPATPITVHHFKSQPIIVQKRYEPPSIPPFAPQKGEGCNPSRPLCPSDISPASGGKPAYPQHPSQFIIRHHSPSQFKNGMNPLLFPLLLRKKGRDAILRAPFVLRTFPPRAEENPHTGNTHHSPSFDITAHHSSNGMNPLLFPLEYQGGGMQSFAPPLSFGHFPRERRETRIPATPITVHHSTSQPITVQTV